MLFSSLILDMVNHERGQDPGVGFMGRFGCPKTLCLLWIGIGYGFQGNYGSVHVRMYLSFSVLNE